MARTNIDIDDDLIRRVMQRYRFHTKREAVHQALQRLAGDPMTTAEALDMRGAGWEEDLDKMRQQRVPGL